MLFLRGLCSPLASPDIRARSDRDHGDLDAKYLAACGAHEGARRIRALEWVGVDIPRCRLQRLELVGRRLACRARGRSAGDLEEKATLLLQPRQERHGSLEDLRVGHRSY